MRFKIYPALLVLLAILATLLVPAGQAYPTAQKTEKSLDIERYPNEPLELLDIKIGEQSVKANIKSKFRRNNEGLDTVTFEGETGWYRRINVKLRNVSDKTIFGLSAHLYFTPPGARNMFGLQLSYAPRPDRRGRLMPGEEVELVVDDRRFDTTMDIMRMHGADPDTVAVTLSIESASFGEDRQWNRGNILRKDPDNPNRWIIK